MDEFCGVVKSVDDVVPICLSLAHTYGCGDAVNVWLVKGELCVSADGTRLSGQSRVQ